ncbi:MAG: OPT/YSL family transporter, partial [Elusimicrobia bacterium]|nr:OPT/YSL family transporter [Elusimicrobiota bacterium]
MAIEELTPEQVLSMTAAEKDRWWLKNVYKGDMPQLNFRSAVTGMLLGGILCLTNLYVGIRTGWTLGVGITSVILSFAMFKVLSKLKLGTEMTVLENNAMQSIATSAGYMTAPLVSSMAAYMAVTGKMIPWQHTMIWLIVLGIMGVLFAFPLKKRFINDEQLPFPEGYAAGIVMDNLHTGTGEEGVFKAKLLGAGAAVAASVEIMGDDKVMNSMHLGWLSLPAHWDDFLYKWFTPSLMGTPLKDLTIQFDSS